MLYPLLFPHISFPALGMILNSIYYGLILGGLLVAGLLINRQMTRVLGYSSRQARIFVILVLAVSLPAGIISSRAANMFYYPVSSWSLDFFWQQLLHGKHQTFHGSLVLPMILIFAVMVKMKIPLSEGWDTIFLHVPLAHAFGRTGCLLVGCCWGDRIAFACWGIDFRFDNPVPLYAIIANLALFWLLRKQYGFIYSGDRNQSGRKGTIAALYLLGYGMFRFVMEWFRKEPVVGFGLTQAQLVMVVFFIIGGGIVVRAFWRKTELPETG